MLSHAALLGSGLLLLLLAVLASLQYRWLDQLRKEQLLGRQAALQVAGERMREHVVPSLSAYRDELAAALTTRPESIDDPLVRAVIELDSNGQPWRWREAGDAQWRTLGQARASQLLGGIGHLARSPGAVFRELRISPAAVRACGANGCRLALLRERALADRFLAPALGELHRHLGIPALRVGVARVAPGGTIQNIVAPATLSPRDFAVTDLRLALLAPPPPDGQWILLANHAGRSLADEVANTFLGNLLASVLILVLLFGVGAAVLGVARRQTRLARQQLVFAASVSHELRTPLSVIATAADNLAAGTVSDPGRVTRYGELIRSEARRLGGMIENVLQFSRSASHDGPAEPLAPAELVDDALTALETRLNQRQVQREISANLPRVQGNRAALGSVLTNLIDNAIRYSRDGDRITISAELSHLRPRGTALCIRVSNPIASSPEPRPERLFEPFYRGHNALSDNIAGTGIGLTVARSIAEQHGGGLSVDTSTSGRISFRLYLPLSG
ncbi:MAG: HAMP domain-containing histidine kinase [Gammaproteobacteria bacterium]|nr:HAMP domain-containing histidine kinase [Gammaproteobacteria bacterium]